jgi:hypothetical protein
MVFVLGAFAACAPGSVESSGDPALDQTAAFLRYCVEDLSGEDTVPSELLDYFCSTAGLATYVPPSPEFEPDMAAAYHGPRPAEGVGWGCISFGIHDSYVILSADDERGLVIAKAYRVNELVPGLVFTWEWPVGR